MTMRSSTTLSFRSALLAAALTVAASAGLNVGASIAGQSTASGILRPFAGLSMTVGDKHAVAYYVAESGNCHVTLLVGEGSPEDVASRSGSVPARFSAAIASGSKARIDTGSGPSLEFECAAGAESLSARLVERLAYAKPAKRG